MYFTKNKKRIISLCGLFLVAAVSFLWFGYIGFEQRLSAVDAPLYNGKSGDKAVAICVNVDWGEDYIPSMLKTLKEQEAKATFFLTGRWIEKFPEVAMMIKDAGMEIGNHGLKHKSPNQMTYEENVADLEAAAKIIKDQLHISTVLFAPPAGEIDPQVQQAAADSGYQLILWSVDTIDWQKPPVETIVARVAGKVQDGSIILMHPTEHTADALPEILSILEEKGLRTVPVSELKKDDK